MTAVRTNLRPDQLPDDLAALRHGIEAVVPVGFASHGDEPSTVRTHADLGRRYRAVMDGFDALEARHLTKAAASGQATHKAMTQVGTLGGGNHFVELCAGDDDRVWVTLHSGSRGTGNQLAQVHMGVAQKLEHNVGLPDRDLAVFLAGTPEMDAYLHDLWWAQAYALLNRDVMLQAVCDELALRLPGVSFEDPIRCHHNYVAVETYDDTELIVTRKGAIRAGLGDLGVIPGSMGTGPTSSASWSEPGLLPVGVPWCRTPHVMQRGPAPSSQPRIWRPRPRASSAARTPAWSTRSRRRTRTSTRSSTPSATWSTSSHACRPCSA